MGNHGKRKFWYRPADNWGGSGKGYAVPVLETETIWSRETGRGRACHLNVWDLEILLCGLLICECVVALSICLAIRTYFRRNSGMIVSSLAPP